MLFYIMCLYKALSNMKKLSKWHSINNVEVYPEDNQLYTQTQQLCNKFQLPCVDCRLWWWYCYYYEKMYFSHIF